MNKKKANNLQGRETIKPPPYALAPNNGNKIFL